MDEKKSTVGPPLYMESLLNPQEYKEAAHIRPNTFQHKQPRVVNDFEANQFKCRWRMGANLNALEVVTINKRLQEIRLLLTAETQ